MWHIDDAELARAIHLLCVIHWIGGVAFVTLVGLPLARATGGTAGVALFDSLERRFAAQVRWTIALAGASGLWMTYRLDLWYRFVEPSFWWMWAMVLVWLVFAAIIYVVEPLAHRYIETMAARQPGRLLSRLRRVHLVLLTCAMVTAAAAVAGAHGGF